MKTKLPLVPSQDEVDKSSEAGANPETLCAHWREGCNGVTDGPYKGRLALCDDCAEAITYSHQ
jgi:hypothetical protein